MPDARCQMSDVRFWRGSPPNHPCRCLSWARSPEKKGLIRSTAPVSVHWHLFHGLVPPKKRDSPGPTSNPSSRTSGKAAPIRDLARPARDPKEGDKERIQAFEGVVIRMRRGGPRASITVRKVSYGIGVERIFPLHSPVIDSITIKSHAHVRRAKLYFLRDRRGKAARMKEVRRGPGGKKL